MFGRNTVRLVSKDNNRQLQNAQAALLLCSCSVGHKRFPDFASLYLQIVLELYAKRTLDSRISSCSFGMSLEQVQPTSCSLGW